MAICRAGSPTGFFFIQKRRLEVLKTLSGAFKEKKFKTSLLPLKGKGGLLILPVSIWELFRAIVWRGGEWMAPEPGPEFIGGVEFGQVV